MCYYDDDKLEIIDFIIKRWEFIAAVCLYAIVVVALLIKIIIQENNMKLTGRCVLCNKKLFNDGICVECYNKNKKGDK